MYNMNYKYRVNVYETKHAGQLIWDILNTGGNLVKLTVSCLNYCCDIVQTLAPMGLDMQLSTCTTRIRSINHNVMWSLYHPDSQSARTDELKTKAWDRVGV